MLYFCTSRRDSANISTLLARCRESGITGYHMECLKRQISNTNLVADSFTKGQINTEYEGEGNLCRMKHKNKREGDYGGDDMKWY